jgi:hypothetical protein
MVMSIAIKAQLKQQGNVISFCTTLPWYIEVQLITMILSNCGKPERNLIKINLNLTMEVPLKCIVTIHITGKSTSCLAHS